MKTTEEKSKKEGGLTVAVTGAAGYLGREVCRQLCADEMVEKVVAIDRSRLEQKEKSKLEFHQLDICSPELEALFDDVDAVFHLAFAIDSNVSDEEAHLANVEGNWSVLRAAEKSGVQRLLVAGSVSAYGALSDNPERLHELHPLRAETAYRYAHHKVLQERQLDSFEVDNPNVKVARFRIAVILGPPPRPGAVTGVLKAPMLFLPRSFRGQFVHVEDVAKAFMAGLKNEAHGAYNVAADPPLSGQQVASVTNQRFVPLPARLMDLAAVVAPLLPLPDPGRVDFLRHSIVVDCSKIADELNWRPRYNTAACLRSLFWQG